MKTIDNFLNQQSTVNHKITANIVKDNTKIRGLAFIISLTLLSILPLLVISKNPTKVVSPNSAPNKAAHGVFEFQRLHDTPYHQYGDLQLGANSIETVGTGGPVWEWTIYEYGLGHDMMDEIWWENEFSVNKAFSYAVFIANVDESIGQLSVFPSNTKGYDAEVYIWLHSGKQHEELDEALFMVVEQWMSTDWPFASVAFPGRRISWKKWAKR